MNCNLIRNKASDVTVEYNTTVYESGTITMKDMGDILAFDIAYNTKVATSASGTTIATIPAIHCPTAARNIILNYVESGTIKQCQGVVTTTGTINVYKVMAIGSTIIGTYTIVK